MLNTFSFTFWPLIWESKGLRIAKIFLKNNKVEGLTLPGLKANYTATVIKTMWYWCEDKQVNQWNRIDCPEINYYIYCHLIFAKGIKTIQ